MQIWEELPINEIAQIVAGQGRVVVELAILTLWRGPAFPAIGLFENEGVSLALQLGFVGFIPFPTAVIGEFGNLPAAVALYAVTLSLAGLAGTLSWFYAVRARLLLPGTPTSLRASGTLRALVLPVVMLGSLLLLPVMGVFVVEWSWLLILPLVVLTRPPRIPGKT